MAWSTRQLAELAGTTVKAVRHYHEVGLLEEPERAPNGYKQYGVAHLIRLLRIKRLADLGLPLSQIAQLGEAEERPQEALRVLDAELAATVERLQRVRAELAVILRHGSPADLPDGFGPVGAKLTAADRGLILIYSRVLAPAGMEALRELVTSAECTLEDAEFEALAPDADEDTRRELAERYAPQVRTLLSDHPDLTDVTSRPGLGPTAGRSTISTAIRELYNAAQIDVMRRVGELNAQHAAEQSS